MIEAGDYALLAVVVWWARVGWPVMAALLGRLGQPKPARRTAPGKAGGWLGAAGDTAAAGALLLLAGWRLLVASQIAAMSFSLADANQRVLDQFTSDPPGLTAVVMADNQHRPLTREGAIFKGGTNTPGWPRWGESPFVRGLVHDTEIFYPPEPGAGTRVTIDTPRFDYLVWVSVESFQPLDRTLAKLADEYGLSMVGFECPVRLAMPDGNYQYACRRRPDRPVAEHVGEIAFIQQVTALKPDAPVAWNDGTSRPLRPGEAVYSGSTGEIWRLEADGSFTRLGGQPGQMVAVDVPAPVTTDDNDVDSASATFDGTRWVLESY
jgi:hypothetical protein